MTLRTLVNGLIIVAVVVTTAVVTFAILSPSTATKSTAVSTIQPGNLQPIANVTTLQSTVNVTATVLPIGVGTPQVGSEILRPFSGKGVGLSSLLRTADPPLMSQQEAMQAIHNLGINFAFGGQFNGKSVTIWAAYGLGTLGEPGKNGQPWLGEQHFPVRTCDSSGKCKETGQFLDHIDHRPMWVIDYGNLDMPIAAPPPWDPNPPPLTHAVYFVDAQMKAVLVTKAYN